MNNNPLNLKYILQETRRLKDNEFVFSYKNSIPSSHEVDRMWNYLCDNYGFIKETIQPEQLPLDSQGNRMTGFRIVRDEDV